MSKETSFNYFCIRLIARYDELWLESMYKDASERFWRLWVMKMLFFAVISETWNKSDLLNIFNKWSALPNGPVEMDCYDFIKTHDSALSEQAFEELLLKKTLNTNWITEPEKSLIDWAIRSIPMVLFTKKTFELVELSHRYKSWRDNFLLAISRNSRAYSIKIEEIRNETILEALF